VLSGVPENWSGTIYLANGFVDAFAPFISLADVRKYRQNLRKFHNYVADDRVVTLDMYWAQHMRSSAEYPGSIYSSTHYHRNHDCNPSLSVCGNVTEALANLVLGNAMAATGWSPSTNMKKNATRTIQFCHACPVELIPFSIDLDPNMVCTDRFALQHKKDWNFKPCPEKCLLTDPVGQQETQSSSVDIRVCTSDTQY
jgi:hypothetical protein